MKKRIPLVFFVFISAFMTFSEVPPIWYESRVVQFPESEYVSAIGSGFNELVAKDNALATISLYFESKVKVQRSTDLYGSENPFGSSEKRKTVSSETTVKSETNLPAVSFTNSFYNSARNEYSVCAYIKKQEAINEYSGKLASGLSRADGQVKKAESSKNSFVSFGLAKRTAVLLSELETTAQYLAVLDGKNGAETLASIDILLNRCTDIMSYTKPKLTFSVRIQNDSDNSVTYTIQQLLESKGFACGNPKPSFIINGNVQFSESKNSVGVFVRPAISLQVFSSSMNEQLGSYSRQYPKYGHNNLEAAYAKARVEIEKDLKANLLDSLF